MNILLRKYVIKCINDPWEVDVTFAYFDLQYPCPCEVLLVCRPFMFYILNLPKEKKSAKNYHSIRLYFLLFVSDLLKQRLCIMHYTKAHKQCSPLPVFITSSKMRVLKKIPNRAFRTRWNLFFKIKRPKSATPPKRRFRRQRPAYTRFFFLTTLLSFRLPSNLFMIQNMKKIIPSEKFVGQEVQG